MNQGLIKWPGGKRQLLTDLERHLPVAWNGYHEPFAGGAALFWYLRESGRAPLSRIADANDDLIGMYRAARDETEALIRTLQALTADISEARYYQIRDLFNSPQGTQVERAAWMLYLNHLCFNGLYRVNAKGHFNVSYCFPGEKARDRTVEEIVRADTIWDASRLLRGVSIERAGFDTILEHAQPGDLVYFDPPYHPRTTTANFTAYAGEFGPTEHQRLAAVVRDLTTRGVHVMLTDHDLPAVRELHAGMYFTTVQARRGISCKGGGRGAVAEVIATNYKPADPRQGRLF